MREGKGTIIGWESTRGSGLAILVVSEDDNGIKRIPCEAGMTARQLVNAFDGKPMRQKIEYTVDDLGVLEGFTPIEAAP